MSILNMWSLGHFIQWSFLGRFVFSNWYIFFILSVGWELIELKLPYEFAVETLENKVSDIVVNTFGFYLGVKLKNNE
ncbi:hypothetical protein OAV46_03150 [Euryarchaeota archaeon]|nr:hypothetical protein [Euryarchaeota archaeon]MDB3854700.1 hypothetical protein [Euryarchaeota archaeon]MDB4865276.1 hypothetical protein [Euryarchaeota archaeon]MDC0851960.1 hypothetical protein [Euryarchaeota archaeon]MDC0963112.1 hypothetical protein [Euryarchaeota archaeon]|tara:strand:+ start:245 stop:475 length:231 start_codon:yes stop_codon:yes gene_type:complete